MDGGSGSVSVGDSLAVVAYSGAGSNGTSYSGGTGGGGCNANTRNDTVYGINGEDNGGAGGAGRGYRGSSSWASRLAGGGAGNPGGKGAQNGIGNVENGTGENGTGGLLIIYTDILNNAGKIESNGSKGGMHGTVGGGSSGGGSINIFYNQKIEQTGQIEVDGGEACEYGSKGGDGTVSVGNVHTGYYEKIEFEKDEIVLEKVLNNEEIIGNNGEKAENPQEYNIKIIQEDEITEKQWSSSDENVATVDENGTVIAVGSGNAIITCKAKNKEGILLTGILEVTVEEKLYLYFYGNEFTSITGGYIQSARTGNRFSATFNQSDVYIDCHASYGGGGIYTTNTFDLTDYKYLKTYGNLENYATSDSRGRLLAITNSTTWGSSWFPSEYTAYAQTGKNIATEVLTCDISTQSGEYYITNGFNQSKGYIYSVWLEK